MHELVASLSATWSPFVLVAGLLLVGHVSAREGLFQVVGSWCARVPGGVAPLLLVTMVFVALVTAVLNLDTSVVFMTPVALHAARTRGTDETAFVYGAVFMSNAASILFVGSNLTNLLIVGNRPDSGWAFTRHTLAPWLLCVAVTIVVLLVWRRRHFETTGDAVAASRASLHVGPGSLGVLVAVVLMLTLREPAPWLLGLGVLTVVIDARRNRDFDARGALRSLNIGALTGLFVLATVVGALARATDVSRHLLDHASALQSALTGLVASAIVNNLPAASLFAAHHVAQPFALLLGLDVGPNVVVTGALSSLLWIRIARREGASVSLVTFSRVGSFVAVAAITGSLLIIA